MLEHLWRYSNVTMHTKHPDHTWLCDYVTVAEEVRTAVEKSNSVHLTF